MNKSGDFNACYKSDGSETQKKLIQAYCSKNLMDASPERYQECLNPDTYCYTCCETEFGDLHI